MADACATLGLQEARFHELRAEVLQGALQQLEPRAPGRPRQEATPQNARVAALEAELRDVRIDANGVLYVLTDGSEGMLYRLNRPAGGARDKTHL